MGSNQRDAIMGSDVHATERCPAPSSPPPGHQLSAKTVGRGWEAAGALGELPGLRGPWQRGSSQHREETVQDAQPVPTARDATWGSRVAPFIVIGIAAMEAGGRGGTAREAGAPWGESGCLLHFPQSLAAWQ